MDIQPNKVMEAFVKVRTVFCIGLLCRGRLCREMWHYDEESQNLPSLGTNFTDSIKLLSSGPSMKNSSDDCHNCPLLKKGTWCLHPGEAIGRDADGSGSNRSAYSKYH